MRNPLEVEDKQKETQKNDSLLFNSTLTEGNKSSGPFANRLFQIPPTSVIMEDKNPFLTRPKISQETIGNFRFNSNSVSTAPEDNSSKPQTKNLTSTGTNKGNQSKTNNEGFQGFILPSIMLKSPGLFNARPALPQASGLSSLNPTPQKNLSASPESLKKRPNFLFSPIEPNEFASPFLTNSIFQTPIIPKNSPQVPPETEHKQETEDMINKLTEQAFENLVESFLSTSFFAEFSALSSVEKQENDVKFYINDVSKQESNAINELKRQVTIKKYELEEKKKVNKSLSQKYEEVNNEVKKIMEKTEVYKAKHSKFERKIKRSSKTYSQVLLPEFEDKERELHMLGGNKSNLSKILDKLKEENHELLRTLDNKKKDLSEIKKKKAEMNEEISKIDELNYSLRQEMHTVKPRNNEISLECSWVNYKNKKKSKRLKSYEDDIERLKKEINELRAGIQAAKQDFLEQNEELSRLDQIIEERIQPRTQKKAFLGLSAQDTNLIDTTRPERTEEIEPRMQEHHPVLISHQKEDLIKILTFLLILLTIILIFK